MSQEQAQSRYYELFRQVGMSRKLTPEEVEEIRKTVTGYQFISRPFMAEPLPSPMDFYPTVDKDELSKSVSKFSQHINETVKYVIDSEALKAASEIMRQSIEKLNQEIARQGEYNLLIARLRLLSRLPRPVIEEKFREYCEAHPEKSPEDNYEDIKNSRTYLQWDVVNKNCKFFSGNEHLKCAVNPAVSCFNCRHVEEKQCKYFLGSQYLKCAVNPTVECSECPHFEE